MDRARWDRIQTLFHEVADRSAGEREEFLKRACGGDAELISAVMALVAEDSAGSSLLDAPKIANSVIGSAEVPFKMVGPYRLSRLLGEGGMGVVYLAERDDLASQAAIKLLRDAWMSPARRERFATEQRILAQLNHPAIARLYDADTLADGTPWFAMEYVEGSTITEYCRSRGVSVVERLRLFRAVCAAVQYAHQHALIHRDLKPSNILVKDDGSVRLLDFGIAKQLDSQADQTRTGLRMMTPAYASPEQIRGEAVGVQTDVYSLGVILYELLSDHPPFDFSNKAAGEAEAMILREDPQKPAADDDLNVLCLTAMHKDTGHRYGSVEALIRDVDHYLKGEPLESRPDRLGYRLGKFVRRNRRAVTAAVLAAATVAGLVVFYTVRLAAARNTALAEAKRTERIMRFLVNLFEGGDKDAGPANDLRVITVIDRGVEQARALNQDPAAQAELYRTLGGVYQKLGTFDKADVLLQNALDQRRAQFGQSNEYVAESLVDLALLRTDEAKLEEAERLAREGLDMTRRTHPPGHPAIAQSMEALGRVLEDRGSYDQSIQVLKQVVDLRSAPGTAPAELASSLLELANVQFYAGHYPESEALNQRLLGMHRQIYGPRHPLVAEVLINLGAIQHDTGHYKEAENFHRQALEITEAFYGKDHAKTASNLTLIARALVYQDRYAEATVLLNRSLEIRERVYGPMHPQVASTLNELGNIASRQDHFDEALVRFQRIVDIYRKAYGGKHYLIGIGLSNLGTVYTNKKDYPRAEPLIREALTMFRQTLPAGHLNIAIAQIKLGRVLLRENRYGEAEAETRGGYDTLAKQASPSASWMQNARKDLAAIYEALHEPDKAREFQVAAAK